MENRHYDSWGRVKIVCEASQNPLNNVHVLEANCTNCGNVVEFTADCKWGEPPERHNINKMLWCDLQRFLWADPVNCGKCGWLVYIEREPTTRASYSQFIGGF